MANQTKIDQLHNLIPKHFNSRTNPNWNALITAIGQEDENIAQLVAAVRQQFFIKTASRPYLDRLAANSNVVRPKFLGMDDATFQTYIPILSYQPKQVKHIIDQLLDIFFNKESTTAFIVSGQPSPYALQNGWELSWLVDEINEENVVFSASDFTNIAQATAEEVVASINRQTKYSYATSDYDNVSKNTYIQIFTNTIGSKGSIRMEGGRANSIMQFNGFNTLAGNGTNTQWTVTKVGQTVTFQHTAGTSPGINQLQVGDVIIVNLPGNVGSFPIIKIDLANDAITFNNLFATVGTYMQTDATEVKFFTPNKYVAFTNTRRAMTWETMNDQIVVEMPASPPVVKRSLIGSAHLNGAVSQMASLDSPTSCTLVNATEFPNSGDFILQPANAIENYINTPTENDVITTTILGRLIGNPQKYTYTSRTAATTTGDILTGSKIITNVASMVGVALGQQIVMNGIPPYAIITSIVGTSVTVSYAATATGNSVAVSFLGNQLTGISPNLPTPASTNEYPLNSLSRTSNVVTGTTASSHNYSVGQTVVISGDSGIHTVTTTGNATLNSSTITNMASMSGVAPDMIVDCAQFPVGSVIVSVSGNTITLNNPANATQVGTTVNLSESLDGGFVITSVGSNTFTYNLIGSNGTASTPGLSRVETMGLASSGSYVIATNSISNKVSRITGAYIWSSTAPFVLSSNTAALQQTIQAGKIIKLLMLSPNTIPSNGGFVIFDYGLKTQEGPVRYLYAPNNTTLALDPSYTFQFEHTPGSGVVSINNMGPHVMSGLGTEYPPYVTDPTQARLILENLILSVKSAGIFVDFLVRYPEQFYGLYNVYNQ